MWRHLRQRRLPVPWWHQRRSCAGVVAQVESEGALVEQVGEQRFKPWNLFVKQGPPSELFLRAESGGDTAPEVYAKLEADECPAQLQARLEFASIRSVLDVALEVSLGARAAELRDRWPVLQARLKELEFDAADAVLILNCMVKMRCFDKELLSKVADRLECKHFGMELEVAGSSSHPAFISAGFGQAANFKSLMCSLPIGHKVKLVLLDEFARDSGEQPKPKPVSEPDGKAKWKTMDPVEMESVERERYLKGRIRVKRIRDVKARETRMRPGARLRAELALQLMQELRGCTKGDVGTLAMISQVCAFQGRRLLHGDLLDDFHELLSRQVAEQDTHLVTPYVLALAAGMRHFRGPEAYRVWRRKLVPAVLRLLRDPECLELLEKQRSVHPWLRGVERPWVAEYLDDVEAAVDTDDTAKRSRVLQCRADRAAQLLCAVAGAHQVTLDCELLDKLVEPLKATVASWIAEPPAERPPVLIPLETIADVFEALVTAGVREKVGLVNALADLFLVQFGADVTSGHLKLSSYAIADLAKAAHGLALCIGKPSQRSEEALSLMWLAAAPQLRQSQPHLALMLLNAMVRGGSEELLTSEELLQAVDEFLVQRFDFDPRTLGHLGS